MPEMAIAPETVIERAAEEYQTLGWTLSLDHPLELYADQLGAQTIMPAERIVDYVGQPVAVAGIVVAYRRFRTQQGRLMVFASLCDARGVAELTLFEHAAEQYGSLLRTGGVVLVRGTVQHDEERGVGVIVHEVRSSEQL